MRFSYLVADYAEVAEIEVNPLLATPRAPWRSMQGR